MARSSDTTKYLINFTLFTSISFHIFSQEVMLFRFCIRDSLYITCLSDPYRAILFSLGTGGVVKPQTTRNLLCLVPSEAGLYEN